jgi:hypothetical protein
MVEMFLPVWVTISVMVLACWGVGTALVVSDSPSIRMLGGWCVFLFIGTLAWLIGFSGDSARPLCWVFACAGVWVCFRRKQWKAMIGAVVIGGTVSALFAMPFLLSENLAAYGGEGVDMWGYVNASEWVRHHPLTVFPTPGAPMRYNWVWLVLNIRERPLIYTALASFGSAAGITPLQAYFAFPAAFTTSLSLALGLTPGVFGLRRVFVAIPIAIVVSFHPSVFLHWLIGSYSGAIVSGCVCLSFATLLVSEQGRARAEALSLVLLMLVFCSALYAHQFLLVAAFTAGIPIFVALCRRGWVVGWRWRDWARLSWLTWGAGVASGLTAAGTLLRSEMDASWGERTHQIPAQILTIFGGASHLTWFGHHGLDVWHYVPEPNFPGWAMATLTFGACIYLAVVRWKKSQDISLPVALSAAAGCVYIATASNFALMRVLPIFGPAILFGLAVLSSEAPKKWISVGLALLCALPLIRSSGEILGQLRNPDYSLFANEEGDPARFGRWHLLGYLYLYEETLGFDWKTHPSDFHDITECFSEEQRTRIAIQWGVPTPLPPNQ